MLGLSRLFSAFNRFAAAVESLAATSEEANLGLRQRLALDGPAPVPALDHTPADDEEGEDATQPVAPSRRGNGRTKAGA